MAPSEFSIRLQKGITGGFAPPTPSMIIIIDASTDNLRISVARREPGTPNLAQEATNTVAIADHEPAIDELHSILKQLPTEQPPGSEDIYGLDTSIAWQSDDLEWCNGGPQGCGGGESYVQADGEQKKNFKRATEIIEKVAGET